MAIIFARRILACLIEMLSINNIVILLLSIYIILGAALFVFQRSFLYFPTPPVSSGGLAEIQLTHDGVELQGYVANEANRRLILYFGGNAEQITYSLSDLAEHFPDYAVIGFNYRSYGLSSGQATEKNLYRDALFLFDTFESRYKHVVVMGRSLGSGVASYVGSERSPAQLILSTPFDSIAAVAANKVWYYPVQWMITDRFDSASRVAAIRSPSLVVIADQDSVVPRAHSERLVRAFSPSIVRSVTIVDAEHNTLSRKPEYLEALKAFLASSQ